MQKIFTTAILLAASITMMAQETYESATMTDQDLNGTARYVGMGGAMEALGADISTISTNPAGIGMFRKSQVSMSVSTQTTGQDAVLDGKKTTLSFDQIGFVFATRTDASSYLNFAFNYHKQKNFNSMLSAVGSLSEYGDNPMNFASLNKLSYMKAINGFTDNTYSTLDYLNECVVNGEGFGAYFNGSTWDTQKRQWGYTGAYDFNISGNINNVLYLGFTASIKDVHYNTTTNYIENISSTSLELYDERSVTGTGVDFTFGAIVRPIPTSPFRFGVNISTPTWYNLRTNNTTSLTDWKPAYSQLIGNYDDAQMSESYRFRLNTPWKFGASVGHTFGTMLALGLSYEYADWGAMDNRIIDGYDYYNGTERSKSDGIMKRHTEKTLRGVSTLKVGAELKPIPELAVRAGYNYVSPKYKTDGYRDVELDSYGVYYSSTADYTNWKATNRLTFGLGYTKNNFSIDLAYQYSCAKGEYHPFCNSYYDFDPSDILSAQEQYEVDINGDNFITNYVEGKSVSNKRHQILLTLGYRF